MYFCKVSILLVVAACVMINAVSIKRKTMKTKIKKSNIQNIIAPPCGCQKPVIDINCGCRPPTILEAALGPIAPFEIPLSGCQSPIIDIPNYRYADPIELNPLGCLFPSIEIPNYGMLSAPMTLPSVEYFTAVDLPCGCPGPKCGCRAPAVKLPAGPREYMGAIEVPNYNCKGLPSMPIGQIIEIPSYAPASIIDVGCRNGIAPCGCQGPCSCGGIPISSCGCQGPCTCTGLPMSACGCQGPCSCGGIPISSCGCQGPCSCPGIPISSCGCQGPCSCPEYQILSCGCTGSCACPEYQILSCGCQGSCSCGGIPVATCGCQGPCGCGGLSCGCQGSCSCPSIQMPLGLMPAIQVPGCGCGECTQYLRQVTLQPPFL